ncbi:MAG: radical SAM family heme chaperone HemW [Eubacteriales bacterium]
MLLSYGEQKRLGIYIHIPFCISKCAYCDFNSAPPQSDEIITRYIDALIAHMESYSASVSSYCPDTVFIGGGTPTSIPPTELYRLIRAVKKNFRLTSHAEFTVEANPATVSYATLVKLHRMGVNRLSMGLQSANDNELKALSRRHTRRDFIRSYKMAREAKFDNINVDLMFGIPYQTPQSLAKSINFTASLHPDHISLYDLKIEPGTAFYQNYAQISPYLPGDDTEADMYLSSINQLRYNGYLQYEISNFARPGHMCVHNLKYWNCEEYLGFGVSAHSYFNGSRFSFTPDIEKYMQGVTVKDSKVRITDECEQLEERERMGEYIMLRFRLVAGVDSREFMHRFGRPFDSVYGKKCEKFIKNGYMTARGGVYSLTPAGMFISNYILSDILEFEDLGRYVFG